jgi:hypothetical protein
VAEKLFDLDAYCVNLAKAGTEHAEQRAFFGWLNVMQHKGVHPMARIAFAVPNGGKRDPITAARLKAEGVKAGVPDICYPLPVTWRLGPGKWHGLFIEMKKDGGSRSEVQDQWAIDLRACGFCVATCWGWRAAVQCFEDYAKGEPVAMEYK